MEWGLRDYGIKNQIGLEDHPQKYIEKIVEVMREIHRVLKKTGSVYLNLGDTYCGSWGSEGKKNPSSLLGIDRNNLKKQPHISPQARVNNGKWLQPKQLLLIPSRIAIALQHEGWILRNTVIWHKPNCMPSSVKDRFTVDFEYLFFFVKNKKYFFEQQFEPYIEPLTRWGGSSLRSDTNKTKEYKGMLKIGYSSCFRVGREMRPHAQGRNKRCVWKISTQSFSEAHFAVFPDALVETPIKAGCPEEVCKRCGKCRMKILKQYVSFGRKSSKTKYDTKTSTAGRLAQQRQAYRELGYESPPAPAVVGHTDCECKMAFEPGVVLDPFCGSGTTCVVAKRLGRNWVGIDINPNYCRMARKRLAKVEEGEETEEPK